MIIAVWTASDELAGTTYNLQLTVYKSLFYVQESELARKFYLKQKNMKNVNECFFSQ